MRNFVTLPACLAPALILLGNAAMADPIHSTPGLEGLGSFEGVVTYTAGIAGQSATLVVTLKNTSPVDNGGYLTAFAFNKPTIGNSQITDITLTAPNDEFDNLLGSSSFDNNVPASPFGDFDIGVSTGNGWLGGGSPHGGIAVGEMESFTFNLTGTGLNLLGVTDFFEALSSNPSEGKGPQAFVARFRGFEDEGSDKVSGHLDNPEPATLVLLTLGVGGLLLVRRSRFAGR